jgi:tRNA-2-methylthio-N6-dimethylallyladenosine synthase
MKADVVAAMAECPEVCEHLHLPAQSGSTRVLKAMRRTYSRERYLELVTRLRGSIPDLSLTTDLIVGFPGETEEDFAETLSLVEEVRYDGAYTFLYSPRPGTEAAERLPDDVAPDVKRERIARLVETVQRVAAERAGRFVGTEREVLVEGPSRTDPSKLRGRLRQNITVNFTGDAAPGALATVRIEGATSTTLSGVQAGAPAPSDLVPASA